ncbi:MAG: hypothetical protein JW384_00464 [Nitrosomonadaceae bacterium]|nr:hypothetical protein [Nitrosomonadaceae bacterium]
MTNGEYLSIPDNLPQLRSDLAPLYDLKSDDYNRIVNELTNLLVVTSRLLQETGNEAFAQSIIDNAAELLRDYDDDVAEFVKTSLSSSHININRTNCSRLIFIFLFFGFLHMNLSSALLRASLSAAPVSANMAGHAGNMTGASHSFATYTSSMSAARRLAFLLGKHCGFWG